MNQEQAKKFLPIITAIAEGKTIQFKTGADVWADIREPSFIDGYEYRIKPEPRTLYIPIHQGGEIGPSYFTERGAKEYAANRAPIAWTVHKFVQEL